jgi:type IV pilus assembly protein PilX
MNKAHTIRHIGFPHRQQGVALVVALVLLLVVTVLGLASMRGTSLQERMSANMYDRSLAFQRSEAALRAAEEAITANWQITALNGQDCSGTNQCVNAASQAFTAGNSGGISWTNVPAAHDDEVNGDLSPGTQQYHIQFMGTGASPSSMGLDANSDFGNYGSTYPPDNVAYYRVTVRSADPADSGDRSIVVLQSTVKRAF